VNAHLEAKEPKSEFSRPLSAMERMSLHMPNANVVVAGRIRGALKTDELEQALPLLRARHPMLAVRVVASAAGAAHFSSQGVELPGITASDNISLVDAVADEHRRPFSWQHGPMLRFRIIRDADDTVLLVTAHHATCDGLSLFYVLRDLVSRIRFETYDSPIPVVPSISTASPALKSSWIERQMMGSLGKKWRRKGIRFTEKDTQQLHETFWSDHHSRTLAGRLTVEETAGLVAACKQRGITVGNAVTTACLQAQQETLPASCIADTTLVSVSLRNRLQPPAGEGLGFYATGLRVAHKYDTQQTVWQNASAFSSELAKLLTDKSIFALRRLELLDPGLIDALAFARGGLCSDPLARRLLVRSGKDRIQAGLLMANLGRLTPPESRTSEVLDAVYGPFVCSDTTEKYMAAATVNDRLHLSLSCDESLLSNDRASSFFECALQKARQLGLQSVGGPNE